MKSSPNLLRRGQNQFTAQPWSPDDLAYPLPLQDYEAGAVVESIFNEASPEAADVSPAASQLNLIKAAQTGRPIRSWRPTDFDLLFNGVGLPWRPEAASAPAFRSNHPAQQAAEKATQILEEARAQAAAIIQQAQQKADEITLQAHRQGWATAEAETSAILQTAKAIIEQIQAWRDELLLQSEGIVIDLVKEIARALFSDGMKLDSEVLQQTFNRILENSRALGDLQIYVNPEDAQDLGPYWREFQISISGHQIQLISSPAIQRGGCFINGQWGSVDGRVETQLKAILDSLTQAAGGEGGSG